MTAHLATVAPTRPTVTAEQMDLIRRTVAKDATDDELSLYLYDCARQGVHPLDKLVFFTKRGGRYVAVIGIDFMRIQASNSGECLGISDPIFEPGALDGPPRAATVIVKRLVQGHVAEFAATARWSEYCPGPGADHMWRKMPHIMLGKCAESLALRKGFPKQLAGFYSAEELDQAIDVSAPAAAPTVRPITEAQRRRLFSVRDKSWTKEAMQNYLFTHYGLRKTTDITTAVYDEICQVFALPFTPPAAPVADADQPF